MLKSWRTRLTKQRLPSLHIHQQQRRLLESLYEIHCCKGLQTTTLAVFCAIHSIGACDRAPSRRLVVGIGGFLTVTDVGIHSPATIGANTLYSYCG
jgi:hypothetical protein